MLKDQRLQRLVSTWMSMNCRETCIETAMQGKQLSNSSKEFGDVWRFIVILHSISRENETSGTWKRWKRGTQVSSGISAEIWTCPFLTCFKHHTSPADPKKTREDVKSKHASDQPPTNQQESPENHRFSQRKTTIKLTRGAHATTGHHGVELQTLLLTDM